MRLLSTRLPAASAFRRGYTALFPAASRGSRWEALLLLSCWSGLMGLAGLASAEGRSWPAARSLPPPIVVTEDSAPANAADPGFAIPAPPAGLVGHKAERTDKAFRLTAWDRPADNAASSLSNQAGQPGTGDYAPPLEPTPAESSYAAKGSGQWYQPTLASGSTTGPVLHTTLREPDKQRVISGVGFYYVRPQWDSNPAFRITRPSATGPTVVSTANFDYDFGMSPRFWLGYVIEEGWGARARFWQLDQHYQMRGRDAGDELFTTAAPLNVGFVSVGTAANPTNLTFDSDLKLYALDLEVIKNLQVGFLKLLYWGGFRYAHLSQDYGAVESAGNYLISGHNLNGFGPTAGLEDRLPIGDTGLELFGSMRGSLLFGNGKQKVRGAAGDSSFVLDDSRNDLLPIGELEVGGQYRVDLNGLDLIFRLALATQVWGGAGNSSRSSGTTTDDGNLGLYGLSFTIAGEF